MGARFNLTVHGFQHQGHKQRENERKEHQVSHMHAIDRDDHEKSDEADVRGAPPSTFPQGRNHTLLTCMGLSRPFAFLRQ